MIVRPRCTTSTTTRSGLLRDHVRRFVAGETLPSRVRACYPMCASRRTPWPAPPPRRLALLGLWLWPGPAVRDHVTARTSTTVLLGAVPVAAANHGVELEVGTSHQPIGALLVQPSMTMSEGQMSRAPHPDARPGRPAGTWPPWTTASPTAPGSQAPARAQPCHCSPRRGWTIRCTACATTPARLAEWFQNFVLFTNYQFYIDEFMRLGQRAEMDARPANTSLHRTRQRGDAAWV